MAPSWTESWCPSENIPYEITLYSWNGPEFGLNTNITCIIHTWRIISIYIDKHINIYRWRKEWGGQKIVQSGKRIGVNSYIQLMSLFPKPDKSTLVLLKKTGFFNKIYTHVYGEKNKTKKSGFIRFWKWALQSRNDAEELGIKYQSQNAIC